MPDEGVNQEYKEHGPVETGRLVAEYHEQEVGSGDHRRRCGETRRAVQYGAFQEGVGLGKIIEGSSISEPPASAKQKKAFRETAASRPGRVSIPGFRDEFLSRPAVWPGASRDRQCARPEP